MSPDEMEERLAAVSTKTMSSETRDDIRKALLAADRIESSWWSRRIPLWQSAAACLIVSAATLFAADALRATKEGEAQRAHMDDATGRMAASTSVVSRGSAKVLDLSPRPAYRIDITRWRTVTTEAKKEGMSL